MNGNRASDKERHRPTIVAVDGPAGSGKSSICAQVCERIGWTYVNTGALYRAVGLVAREKGVDLADEIAMEQVVRDLYEHLRWDARSKKMWYGAKDLTEDLYSEEAGKAASVIAKQQGVRARLLPLQRELAMASPQGAFVDGRDIGTVVFPEADLKIFLTASLEERSRRRLHQLGVEVSREEGQRLYEDIKETIAYRDEQDQARGVSPLKKADDAIVVDTSHMTQDEVAERIIDLLRQKELIARTE